MWILIVGIVVIGTIAAGASLLWDKDKPLPISSDCKGCDDYSTQCEQKCMLEAAVKDIEYFDDEELDAYQGRDSNSYTEDEVEEFRKIMETIRSGELKAWQRSLTLRGVNMPDEVKDEYILLVAEQ